MTTSHVEVFLKRSLVWLPLVSAVKQTAEHGRHRGSEDGPYAVVGRPWRQNACAQYLVLPPASCGTLGELPNLPVLCLLYWG